MDKIKIALTMGDPSGVGAETIVKLFLHREITRIADITVIGDLFPMLDAQRRTSRKISIRPVDSFNEPCVPGVINLMDMKLLKLGEYPMGSSTKKGGRSSYLYVKKAVDAAKSGLVDAIVTAPINKHALHMSKINYPGHTEILAHETGIKNFGMMLMGGSLKVMLVTIHTALKNVPRILTPEKVYSKIKLVNDSLIKDFGIMKPSIAVLGLNPHAGEEGAFGDEETRIIKPAILRAQKSGINAQGPFPPDTIFQKIVKDRSFDAAVCMYHDQGLIPLKLIAFDTGVNVTLGLPIVRTSPDHGTAYDIAGTGQASENSLIAAVKAAVEIAKNRGKIGNDKKMKHVR